MLFGVDSALTLKMFEAVGIDEVGKGKVRARKSLKDAREEESFC